MWLKTQSIIFLYEKNRHDANHVDKMFTLFSLVPQGSSSAPDTLDILFLQP